jgi:hypothetical protein
MGCTLGEAVTAGGVSVTLLVIFTGDNDVVQPAHTETASPFVGMISVCASE